jgi:hypothetical protein
LLPLEKTNPGGRRLSTHRQLWLLAWQAFGRTRDAGAPHGCVW